MMFLSMQQQLQAALEKPDPSRGSTTDISYKNLLQEWLQGRGRGPPTYSSMSEGPSHQAVWISTVTLPSGMGMFKSEVCINKSRAEQEAARKACLHLGIVTPSENNSPTSSPQTEHPLAGRTPYMTPTQMPTKAPMSAPKLSVVSPVFTPGMLPRSPRSDTGTPTVRCLSL